MRRYLISLLVGGVGVALAATAVPASAAAPGAVLVSLANSGAQANDHSAGFGASGDGRYVLFGSAATNLVAGDTNGVDDLFVRDRRSNRTTRVSVANGGGQANGGSDDAAISRDGRFVAFRSEATNLVPGDTNGQADVFLHDRLTHRTVRVSAPLTGQLQDPVYDVAISADGRTVSFSSPASNLVAGDTNEATDVFVHHRATGRTGRASVGAAGAQGAGFADGGVLSADGRFVAFESTAANLVPGDTNEAADVFVRDLRAGTTRLVEAGASGAADPTISADGRYVGFTSYSALVPADQDEEADVYVRDLRTGGTELASAEGGVFPMDQFGSAVISADGRYLAFHVGTVFLTRMAPPGSELTEYEAIYDRRTHKTVRAGQVGDRKPGSRGSFFTADSRTFGFTSADGDLVPVDTNEAADVFLTRLR